MKPAMTEAPNSPSVYRGGARRAGALQTECVEGRMGGVSPFIRILRGLGLALVSLMLM